MKYFVTGIGTGVGKTVVSAILTEALEADYWKPIQAGDLHNSDSMAVKSFISNPTTTIHPEAFKLLNAMSPHAAAALENLEIKSEAIALPETKNHLVIEGAGGVLVPLNTKETMLDLMREFGAEVILVSSGYLGSINHSLLSWEVLKAADLKVKGIVFCGEENAESEKFILKYTGLPCLLRVKLEKGLNKELIVQYARDLKRILK